MKTILLVEDDQQCGAFYAQELADVGFQVVRASDGEEALQRVKGNPDLVVLDIDLPGMSGIEVLERILAVRPAMPVILHTAYGAFMDDFNSWAATAYVVKSSDLTELKTRITEALAAPVTP